MFYALVLVIHILVSVFLILVVLLQSGRGGDIASAFGGAGAQTVFGPRAAGSVLSRLTTASAVIFMGTSLLLVLLSQGGAASRLKFQGAPAPPASSAPAPSAPAPTPAAPPAE